MLRWLSVILMIGLSFTPIEIAIGQSTEAWKAQVHERLATLKVRLFKFAMMEGAKMAPGATSRVMITLDRTGKVVSADIVERSGWPLFDEELKRLVFEISPLPAMLPSVPSNQVKISFPVTLRWPAVHQ